MDTLRIDGTAYYRVVLQRAATSVYRGEDGYLRIGSPAATARLLERHRALAEAGFPVASIVREGTYEGQSYYVESSLGEERLGVRFRREWESGVVSESAFDSFLDIVLRVTDVQIAAGPVLGSDSLEQGIHLDAACAEAPQIELALRARFRRARERLGAMPTVACHGDFNPQNLFPSGMIDFEDVFAGPLGYDQVSAIYTTELNPAGAHFEFPARYRFSEAQVTRFYQAVDARFAAAGFIPLSRVRRDLEFCRSVWTAKGMGEWPETRAWRLRHLETFLDDTIE